MGDVLTVRNLKTAYKTRHGEFVYAVDDVSFSLQEGRTVGIAGESGCGKSTLALSLMGFYFPPLTYLSGDIEVNGTNIMKLPYEILRKSILGKELAYIPQAAMNALNPTARISKFVYDIMKEHDSSISREKVRALLQERFALLGLPERVVDAYPTELSGGMKQRAVILVSTILNPRILITDEPTSALDVSSQKLVMQMIHKMMKLGIIKSVIYITHELPLLRHITDEIMIMYAGQIVEHGTTGQVIFDPIHPYTKALMGSIIVPEEDAKDWKITGIPGSPPNLKKIMTTCRFADRCRYCGIQCKEHKGLPNSVASQNRFYRCDIGEDKLREVYGNE
jgi:peptide/nickel transport system ATP-binding protein